MSVSIEFCSPAPDALPHLVQTDNNGPYICARVKAIENRLGHPMAANRVPLKAYACAAGGGVVFPANLPPTMTNEYGEAEFARVGDPVIGACELYILDDQGTVIDMLPFNGSDDCPAPNCSSPCSTPDRGSKDHKDRSDCECKSPFPIKVQPLVSPRYWNISNTDDNDQFEGNFLERYNCMLIFRIQQVQIDFASTNSKCFWELRNPMTQKPKLFCQSLVPKLYCLRLRTPKQGGLVEYIRDADMWDPQGTNELFPSPDNEYNSSDYVPRRLIAKPRV